MQIYDKTKLISCFQTTIQVNLTFEAEGEGKNVHYYLPFVEVAVVRVQLV